MPLLTSADCGTLGKVLLSLSDEDFGKLVSGKTQAQRLFMSGKLKIKGDVMKVSDRATEILLACKSIHIELTGFAGNKNGARIEESSNKSQIVDRLRNENRGPEDIMILGLIPQPHNNRLSNLAVSFPDLRCNCCCTESHFQSSP